MSSRPWYGFAGFLLVAIMFASAPAHADDVTTYPTVVITGTFVTSDGYVINCFTTSCQNLEVSLQMMYSKMYSDISQGNGGSARSTPLQLHVHPFGSLKLNLHRNAFVAWFGAGTVFGRRSLRFRGRDTNPRGA